MKSQRTEREATLAGGGDAHDRVPMILHDLRNHATVINGFAQFLVTELDTLDPAVVRDRVERVARHASQLCAVLDARTGLAEKDLAGPERFGQTGLTRLSGALPRERRRLVVVEDDDDYFTLLEAMLTRPHSGDEVVQATCLAEARVLVLQGTPSCTLVDLSLPDASGLDALDNLRSLVPAQPIVVVTGGSEDLGLEAVRHGAQDYLVKGRFDSQNLERSVQYAIERMRLEFELAHQALHDPLTGLPNRTLFLDRVERAVARLERHTCSLAVLFLDLDHFKLVNDTLGHEVGDQLLRAVAERLAQAVRRADTVARFGGDEFTILCEDLSDQAEAVGLAEHLIEVLAAPFALGQGHQPVTLGASIGVVVTDTAAADPKTMLANADTAMYRAKAAGTNRAELFDDAMRARAVARFETERSLRLALERDELRLHYQPQVALSGGPAVAVEALLRWQHPEEGLLAPERFLSVAEHSQLILPIGTWVLQTACAQLQQWHSTSPQDTELTVWVNVSPSQVNSGDLVEIVTNALATSGAPPTALGLEITEEAVIGDIDAAVVALASLRALGVKVALDDFGMGYASLNWLRRLPLDVVKLDKSFIDEVASDRADKAIVASVIALAHSLELTVVAEGVETEAQLATLNELGCDIVQGYLLGRPGPPDALPVPHPRQSLPVRLARAVGHA